MCDHAFPAVCRVNVEFTRRTNAGYRGKEKSVTYRFKYDLCRVCVIFEREIRDEITFAQSERWSRRLIAALKAQPVPPPAPPPEPEPAPPPMRRRKCLTCGKRYNSRAERGHCRKCAALEIANNEPVCFSHLSV